MGCVQLPAATLFAAKLPRLVLLAGAVGQQLRMTFSCVLGAKQLFSRSYMEAFGCILPAAKYSHENLPHSVNEIHAVLNIMLM